jgi:hypothetical protein
MSCAAMIAWLVAYTTLVAISRCSYNCAIVALSINLVCSVSSRRIIGDFKAGQECRKAHGLLPIERRFKDLSKSITATRVELEVAGILI